MLRSPEITCCGCGAIDGGELILRRLAMTADSGAVPPAAKSDDLSCEAADGSQLPGCLHRIAGAILRLTP